MEESLKNNRFYKDCIYGYTTVYDDIILHLLILMEEPLPIQSKLHIVKYLKDNCDSGLHETKTFLDILVELNLIDSKYNAKNSLYYFNTNDIMNVIKNNVDINIYLRIKKVQKINTKLTI